VFTDVNPPSHEQGTDRPGRGVESAGTHRRSGVEMTDWHELEKHRFVDRVASALEGVVRSENVKAIVIIAPARTLAELRRVFRPDVKKRILTEVEKDLTNHPVYGIEKHLVGMMTPR
jgi:protein required for attachment to host cells